MRSKLALALLCSLLFVSCLAWSQEAAPATPEVTPPSCTYTQYCQLRQATAGAELLGWPQVAEEPAAYEGRVFEAQGQVVGTVTCDGTSGLLILKPLEGPSLTLEVDQFDCCLRSGKQVRALALLVEGSDRPLLKLMAAIAEDVYLYAEQAAPQPQPVVTGQAPAAPQQTVYYDPDRYAELVSRGMAQPRADWNYWQIAPGYSSYTPAPAPVQPEEQTWDNLVRAYAGAAKYFNKRLSDQEAVYIADTLLRACAREGLSPQLAVAIIACESSFNPKVVSSAGAAGLGQLMPGTAKGFGVTNVFDIKQNLDASLKLISGHLRKYEGRDPWDQLSLALACYNAGPGAVKKYGGVPPYRETTNYIRKITDLYLKLTGLK